MPHVSVPRQGPLGKGYVVAAWEREALWCDFSALLSSLSQLSCILLLPLLLFFPEEEKKETKALSPSRFFVQGEDLSELQPWSRMLKSGLGSAEEKRQESTLTERTLMGKRSKQCQDELCL